MKIAVEGCAHGELEKIYDTIEYIEKEQDLKIDLLICCGDFQATRNSEDLQTMAVPKKYQEIGTFYKYYSGEKVAPVLTLVIGGNHEASNHLQELPYGGWLAPKIYYLGYAGVVNVNGIRIAGLSGIYKSHDFHKGRYEFSPYSDSSIRSVYHVRNLDVFRLKQLSGLIDIVISHDWPRGIYNFGNSAQLIRFKPNFRDEIESNTLGSPASEKLLQALKPTHWFAAHLHCKFAAVVHHEDSDKITKFLALDKCLPSRRFLQIVDIESEIMAEGNDIKLEYDLEWLTILELTNNLISVKPSSGYMPGPNSNERYEFTPTDEEKQAIRKKFMSDLQIPENFSRTVEVFDPKNERHDVDQPKSQINPQNLQFCDVLGIDDPLRLAMVINGHELSHSSTLESSANNESSFCSDQMSFSSNTSQISPLKRTSLAGALPKPKIVKDSNPESLDIWEDGYESQEDDLTSQDDEETTKYKEVNSSKGHITEKQSVYPKVDVKSDSNNGKMIVKNSDSDEEVKLVKKIDPEITPPVKKFKRRNQNIYAAQDDD